MNGSCDIDVSAMLGLVEFIFLSCVVETGLGLYVDWIPDSVMSQLADEKQLGQFFFQIRII